MSCKRKNVELKITISVPADMKIQQVRMEVKALINEQCNYIADEGDVKVKNISYCRSILE